jgi:rRNA small subunit pseudouridine methyltransferase Nep1
MALIFILAESALELVPKEVANHPSVAKYAEKLGKKPTEILLDRSYHHEAMKRLSCPEKRGRPDIAHITLLEVLGTPLNREALLQTYVHTIDDRVIKVNPAVRLPRNFERFKGLIEQLYAAGRVPKSGEALLSIERLNLKELKEKVNPSKVIAFSTVGKPKTLSDVCSEIAEEENPAVIVGGFPHGHFRESTLKIADEVIRVDKEALEAWVIASRIIYQYELATGLPEKRLWQARL